jgi:uncharacterized protein DUF1905
MYHQARLTPRIRRNGCPVHRGFKGFRRIGCSVYRDGEGGMVMAKFKAKLQKRPNKGGWAHVVWRASVKFFGTRGLVKVRGTVEGYPFRSSFMAMGGGKHMLPIKAEIRKAIEKDVGDVVTVLLEERIK